VGLGLMGFQDALYELRIPYASQEAVEFADHSMEAICYYAYWASTELAARSAGATPATKGSLWDQGILPFDTLDMLAQARGGYVEVDRSSTLDWDALRKKIAHDGMRNSNCVAIAPTATISNIIGVDASIEPCFGNLSVKSNLSGEFTVINRRLVRDLKRLGLWDDVMIMDLKHFKGSLHPIDRVPQTSRRCIPRRLKSTQVVGGSRFAPPKVDRSGPEPEHLHGRRSGKKLDDTCNWHGCAGSRPPTTCARKAPARGNEHREHTTAQRRVVHQKACAGPDGHISTSTGHGAWQQ
jgi:ribonucleoside-diphosphate reductase alpha chain